jgi:hypothetical protein
MLPWNSNSSLTGDTEMEFMISRGTKYGTSVLEEIDP